MLLSTACDDTERAEQLQSLPGTCTRGYSCSGLGPSRVYYAEGNTLIGFVALHHKIEHN